jgi:hypothetical protein
MLPEVANGIVGHIRRYLGIWVVSNNILCPVAISFALPDIWLVLPVVGTFLLALVSARGQALCKGPCQMLGIVDQTGCTRV